MKSRSSVTLITIISLSLVFVAWRYTAYAIENRPEPQVTHEQQTPPTVSVINVNPASHSATLQGYGQANPRFMLSLKAEVSGRINHVDSYFEEGNLVKQGDRLAQINGSLYQQAVAAARFELAEANVALLQEQQQARQAQQEWQQSGLATQQPSPLVLRKPQLVAAQARIDQATAALNQAEYELAQTAITAPFNAIIIRRDIAPGQYIQAGETIAELYSSERMDIRVSLPLPQWQLLPAPEQMIGQQPVTLSDNNGNQWLGIVSAIEHHIDEASRQKSLVVSVDKPLQQSPALLPGSFLQATLQGRNIANLLEVPASALTPEGDIWQVNADQSLTKFKAVVQFRSNGQLYVSTPSAYSTYRVLTHPLPAYLPGQRVSPRTVVASREASEGAVSAVSSTVGSTVLSTAPSKASTDHQLTQSTGVY